jgi:diguanylate cyclase (GGDEF)-like protein
VTTRDRGRMLRWMTTAAVGLCAAGVAVVLVVAHVDLGRLPWLVPALCGLSALAGGTLGRGASSAPTPALRLDALTGLPTRRQLEEYGDGVLADPAGAALVVVDLDMFREINSTLGHIAGDRLLAEVGRRLAGFAIAPDLVVRLSGDEFACLHVGVTSVAAAEAHAHEVLATLEAPIEVDGLRVRVEASAGVAVSDETLTSARPTAELLRRADVAMHQAKRGGPRVLRYSAERDPADVARLTLGSDLPRAVADREFAVSFQPIVDLATGQMIAAEALARWRHPDRGDLDPRRFLASVERSGLLPAFAESVLDQALGAMVRWHAAGVPAPVAVNVSARSLLDPTFARMVLDRLAAHGVDGSDLVLELTEMLTLGQLEAVDGVLNELRAAGVRLALDDFGTGFSSLALLTNVPVYEIKVDRGFVAAMATSPSAAAVVQSTVELGARLGLLVVAEGVERLDQQEALWALGCPAAQGHLYARPTTVDELLVRLGAGAVPGRLAAPMQIDKVGATHPEEETVTADQPKPAEALLYDDPATADLSAKVAQAWTDFDTALAQALPTLPVNTELVLILDSAAAGMGEALYAVSVGPVDADTFAAHAVSNATLDPDHRLPRQAVASMVALGWAPPGVGGDDRFSLTLPVGQVSRLAAIVSRTLREVYGAPHPAFLVYSVHGENAVEALTLGAARPEPAPGAGDHPDLGELSLADKVSTVIAAMLETTPENLPVDGDGDISIRSGSAMVFVRVRDNPPLVDVFSPVLTDVNANEKLYVKLSELTHRMPIGRLYCTAQTVWASVPVFGRDFQPTHLMLAVQVMTGLADELDDRLHGEFGGKRFFSEGDLPNAADHDADEPETGMYL